MIEAFLIGMIAKSCATAFTYPLTRAKVQLTVRSKEESMVQVIKNIFREDGIHGIYEGLQMHLE